MFRGGPRWQLLILAIAAALLVPAAAQATPTFLSAINISDAGQDGFEPQVVVDTSGRVSAVWTRSDGSNFRIQTSDRTAAGPWSAPQTISDPGMSASGPNLAVDPSGNVLAVWTRFDGSNGRIQAAYKPAAGTFGVPATVSASGGDASAPDVSIDNSGNAIVVWQRSDGTNLRVQAAIRSPGSGGTFGAISTLSAPGQDGFEPKAAAGPSTDNNAAVVWTRSDGTNLRVQSARRSDVTNFPRPKGATPTRLAMVPSFRNCTAPNSTHGPSLVAPSCNPPVMSSSLLTIGTPDANGAAANFSGSVRFIVTVGNPATEADEADVRLVVSLPDIRNNPSLTDYTGNLSVSTTLRITDTNNAEETPASGTVQDIPYKFTVPCVATGSTSIGSTCSVNTTADALAPNTVQENRRAIWEIGDTFVKDAGPNNIAGDGDDSNFLHSGVFVP